MLIAVYCILGWLVFITLISIFFGNRREDDDD